MEIEQISQKTKAYTSSKLERMILKGLLKILRSDWHTACVKEQQEEEEGETEEGGGRGEEEGKEEEKEEKEEEEIS